MIRFCCWKLYIRLFSQIRLIIRGIPVVTLKTSSSALSLKISLLLPAYDRWEQMYCSVSDRSRCGRTQLISILWRIAAYLVFPEFCLTGKYQCHRAHGIEPVVQKEAEFLKHLLFQKMCFVQNTHDVFMLDPADDLDLFLELPFGIAPVETGFQPKLVKASPVEPSRCQL